MDLYRIIMSITVMLSSQQSSGVQFASLPYYGQGIYIRLL